MTEGIRTTFGTRLLGEWVPDHDSALVRRLRNAGAIIVGKTNTPEFGLLPVTEPERFGPARNPWDRSRTPGGSSGGSACAVASGMIPLAHGNDGGGSIRIPASCCGLVGLKPSRGRVSMAPDYSELVGGIGVDGVVSRTVADTATALDIMAGYEPGDPYWAPDPATSFSEAAGGSPASCGSPGVRRPRTASRSIPTARQQPGKRQRPSSRSATTSTKLRPTGSTTTTCRLS